MNCQLLERCTADRRPRCTNGGYGCDILRVHKQYQTAEAKGSAEFNCSVAEFSKGVWFKSATNGQLYKDKSAAGEIDCVYVDGIPFDRCASYPI